MYPEAGALAVKYKTCLTLVPIRDEIRNLHLSFATRTS